MRLGNVCGALDTVRGLPSSACGDSSAEREFPSDKAYRRTDRAPCRALGASGRSAVRRRQGPRLSPTHPSPAPRATRVRWVGWARGWPPESCSGTGTWRNNLWALRRRHARQRGLRRSLRSLHRRHARQGRIRRSLRSLHRHPARERLGFVAHVRRVIHLHEMQTVLAGCGVCKNAGTCRLCHTGCVGYHRERCESYGG